METRNSQTATDYNPNVSVTSVPYLGAVSWAAIFAGAAAAAAISLILLLLGTGLGFSMVSPWAQQGVSATTFGVSSILWVTITSLIASALGGYIAGRLRTRWIATHSDEVYFRDTAHGFLSWAIATLATASLLTGVIGTIIGGAVQTGATLTGGVAATAAAAASNTPDNSKADLDIRSYYLDMLFRKDATATDTTAAVTSPDSPPANSAASKAEVARIYTNALSAGALPPEDARYVGQVIAQRNGISQADGEKRAKDTFIALQTKLRDTETAARLAAEKARKATAYTSLWLFISLLIGAFVASLAAVFGGRQRDF